MSRTFLVFEPFLSLSLSLTETSLSVDFFRVSFIATLRDASSSSLRETDRQRVTERQTESWEQITVYFFLFSLLVCVFSSRYRRLYPWWGATCAPPPSSVIGRSFRKNRIHDALRDDRADDGASVWRHDHGFRGGEDGWLPASARR